MCGGGLSGGGELWEGGVVEGDVLEPSLSYVGGLKGAHAVLESLIVFGKAFQSCLGERPETIGNQSGLWYMEQQLCITRPELPRWLVHLYQLSTHSMDCFISEKYLESNPLFDG